MIKINKGQYYIVLAETDTGIILDSEGVRNITKNIPYIIFNSLDEAENYAFQKVSEASHIECNIYNDKSEFIKVVNKI